MGLMEFGDILYMRLTIDRAVAACIAVASTCAGLQRVETLERPITAGLAAGWHLAVWHRAQAGGGHALPLGRY